MRILGIDPGSRVTGYGIVDGLAGRCAAVAQGTVRLGDGPLAERLLALHRALSGLVAEHRPEAMAIEGIFVQRAPRSALVLGHARGIALLCAAQAELPLFEYPPATVKRSLTSGGASSKAGVARAVAMLLGLRGALAADATDALAVAICHLARHRSAAPPAGAQAVPAPWLRALAAAPVRQPTAQNTLLQAALRRR